MATKAEIQRYINNMNDELNAAAIYQKLSDLEDDKRLSDIYARLAETERKHADAWNQRLREAGVEPPAFRPALRTRVLVWLATKLGVESVLPSLAATEHNASGGYANQPEAANMLPEEQSHARVLRQLSRTSPGGMQGGILARMEGRHRAAGGNALRAAVLGASDGLLSNFNLIMGVAGAQLASSTILLTGFAGLLAGAISMALGEYISVQSSRELYQKQIATEREEIKSVPDEEVEELVLIYQARGLDEQSARALAGRIMKNPETALDTLARDELGINPEELGGSAWEAAITSFLLFAIGAIIPVIPYMFLTEVRAIIWSAGFSAIALFGIGSAITLFTGRSIWYSGTRQVLFGLAAAAATFIVGRLIGVSISG